MLLTDFDHRTFLPRLEFRFGIFFLEFILHFNDPFLAEPARIVCYGKNGFRAVVAVVDPRSAACGNSRTRCQHRRAQSQTDNFFLHIFLLIIFTARISLLAKSASRSDFFVHIP